MRHSGGSKWMKRTGDWSLLTLHSLTHWSRHFQDDILKRIFSNENCCILMKMSLKFVSHGPINNIPSLVHIMAWHRPGDKLLSESMVVSLLTNICVTRPQRVNCYNPSKTHSKLTSWMVIIHLSCFVFEILHRERQFHQRSALLNFCERHKLVTSGFLSQRDSYVKACQDGIMLRDLNLYSPL